MTAHSHSASRALGPIALDGLPPPGGDGPDGLAAVTLLLVVLLLYTSVGPAGCGSGGGGMTEPTWPDGPSGKEYHGIGTLDRDNPNFQPASTQVDDGDVADEVELPTLAEACGLREDSVFFEPESSELSDTAQQTLGSVGWCLTAGPLKGLDIEVIGFTDPSPDNPAYSEALAAARARSVAEYLGEIGVAATRMDVHAAAEPDVPLSDDFTPVALERDQWDEVRRVLIRIDPD